LALNSREIRPWYKRARGGVRRERMELIRFIFSSFWVWLGVVILVCTVCGYVVELVKALRRNRKITARRTEEQVTITIENAGFLDVVLWKSGSKSTLKSGRKSTL